MPFLDSSQDIPLAFDRQQGVEARRLWPDAPDDIGALIEGAAGCSYYLRGLIEAERDWLPELSDGPAKVSARLFGELEAIEDDHVETVLRTIKRRFALVIALADLGGGWGLSDVTGTLTRFADKACDIALRKAVARERRREKLPPLLGDNDYGSGGLSVLAMGKMGAYELNYSSDIDLICLIDETQYNSADFPAARASLVRATRAMSASLSERTSQGYVFRTDLRLRPDPGVTPVAMAMAAAENYYESLGRTWERAAFIKARAAAGDIRAGEQFLKTLKPFVWRKFLDFAAIEDAHNMRLRIREHKGTIKDFSPPGYDIKLGRGGIREIEFFTQTRQLIAGGRDPDLRVRGTVEGLARLADAGWVPPDVSARLSENYTFYRNVEHRIQMLRDAHTHVIPVGDEDFARLAGLMATDSARLHRKLEERFVETDDIIARFFQKQGSSAPQSDDTQHLDQAVLARWPSYPALRSSRSAEIFTRLRAEILSRIAKTTNPNETLNAFDAFLAGLPAGVQVFSLFEANPQLIDLMVDVAGTSPFLAEYLSRNASVFDAVIAGDFFSPWPGRDVLVSDLDTVLAAEGDYERVLDAARRWQKEWHFRIGVHHLRGVSNAATAGQQYADLAQAIVVVLSSYVSAHFSVRHGPAPGRGAAVVAMGSLGGGHLTSQSDLDLIVVYDAQGEDMSTGDKPLATRQYFTRLTKTLITALSAPTAEGKLYDVDMRLRPSGNQGPVAVSLRAYQDYQRHDAWTWEHLAMTRAQVVFGEKQLWQDVENLRTEIVSQRTPENQVVSDVRDMRAKIAAAKGADGQWDPKLGPGRIQDIELIAQAALLVSGHGGRSIRDGLAASVAIGWYNDAEMDALNAAYGLCSKVVQCVRLLSHGPTEPGALGQGEMTFLLRETGFDDFAALARDFEDTTTRAAILVAQKFGETGAE